MNSFRSCCLVLVLLLSLMMSVAAAVTTPVALVTGGKNVIVWQEFHPWLMITEDPPAGRTCYYLSHLDRSKMTLKPSMPGTWSPVGSAIKWLFFVGASTGLDRLQAHNVDYHQDFVIVPSVATQVGCGMVGNKCVFGQYRATMVGDHYPVDMFDYDASSSLITTACVSDSEKTQFAHDGSLIVYRANLGGGAYAIYGHYFDLPGEFLISARNGLEPSVCSPLVAWAEVNGPGFNIMAKNLETGEMRTVAYTTSNPPCPEAGRGAIFWQDVRNASTAPDIYGYDWDAAQEFAVTTAAGSQSRLRVCDDLVTWVTGNSPYQILWAATIAQTVKVKDLRPTLVTGNSVDLAWTSVGGTAYDLRTRTDGPVTDANWATSTQVTGLPTPRSTGLAEAFTVNSLATGHHWFAIKARLSNGAYTPLSNVVCSYNSDPSAAFAASDGAYVTFTGVVSGCEQDGSFYCQASAGFRAVRMVPRTGEAAVGVEQLVAATGAVAQDPDSFGPTLSHATITGRLAAQMPDVVAMSNKALGGYDARWGGTSEFGAPNFWARVRTWGRVSGLSTLGGCSFYLTDGSGCSVHVTSPYPPPPSLANGAFAVVDGIACVSRTAGPQFKVVSSEGVRVP